MSGRVDPSLKPLVLVDGSSWLFRAFHALPPLTAPDGQPTGAVYGMGNMLRRLMKDYAPEYLCVVFDPKGDTFRNALYSDYKANRSETPEDLLSQFPIILELLAGLGVPVLTVDNYEADDVIGTLTCQAVAAGRPVLIVTSDKDMAQLVGEHVHLLDTMKNTRLDPAGVREKFGVPPERIVDYLALMGDSVDNIPGVAGCGPKTAAKWLNEYGTLDDVIANAGKIGGKVGENLRAVLERLPLSRQLATIHCDVGLPVSLEELRPGAADPGVLAALYRRLGFHRWVDELGAGAGAPAAPAVELAAATAEIPPERPASPATQAECVLDAPALDALLARLQAADLVSFDTETDSIDSNRARLVGLSFAVDAGQGWYLPVGHDYLGAPAQLPLSTVLDRLRPLLEDASKPKLAQHAKYDINVLAAHGVQLRGLRHDTMLQSYVLDPSGSRHDMDTLAEKHLGHRTISFEDVAGKGKGQLSFNQVPVDRATQYAAEDADVTLRLHQALYPRLDETPSLLRVYEDIEMPLVPVLAQMEQLGVKLDVPLLRQVSGELAQRMEELKVAVYREAGGEFNLGSPKQLCEILYTRLQLPVLGKTPKGEPSTSEDVLEELSAHHPLPKLILEWRGLQKLRSTYSEQLPLAVNPRTGRVHTSYHQAVAATGRLSSSDPNLQNIPVKTAEGRRIRQAFVPEAGMALLSIDYSQIELRLMAHFSGDARLQEAFRQGHDIHRATAADVFATPFEQVTGEQRRAAKAINFGLIYGMSAFGLARNLGIGRGEAQDYIDRFFGRYPGVKRYMDGAREQARREGYVETLFGRRLYLPNIRSRNQGLRAGAERVAINAPLQGTAADLIKKAMIDLQQFLAREAPELRMILQVHDELVFEGPTERLRAMAPVIARRMCQVVPLEVPLVADWGVGSNWDAAHDAEASASSGN